MTSTCRASFALYNTKDDVDAVLAAVVDAYGKRRYSFYDRLKSYPLVAVAG